MKCGMDLCIYNDKEVCCLNSISIDASGGCADCILVSIEKNVLEKYKKELLDKYLQEDSMHSD